MNFQFFTFGGSQFWEDVFFYQKWRIQRNYESKSYRLLDPWDIRRHAGTFEECRKAFLKYIEIYEIGRQRGHMVIMLHGLGDSKNIFKPLWREALKEGWMAAAINYPSTQKRIDSHVRQLNFLLNNLEDVQEVSFVTKGAGGLILRSLLAHDSPWRHTIKIKRIVQICPPNNGSKLMKKLCQWSFFRFILGPMAEEMTPERVKDIPVFSNKQEFGIINCGIGDKKLYDKLPEGIGSVLKSRNDIKLGGAREVISLPNKKWNPLNNPKIVKATINFLKNGKF